MKLTNIIIITARLELLTGLHIGAGDGEMHIGGVDNPVIRHPLTRVPYIPGSSLKGKMRSLLEWRSGAVREDPLGFGDRDKPGVLPILQLFGVSGDAQLTEQEAGQIGPTRLAFWDCCLDDGWVEEMREDNLPLIEVKSENSINRISGTASNPRQTERVPAGAFFNFRLSFKKLDGDDEKLLDMALAGLKLLELDSLGGSGSRGYGKVAFTKLQIDGDNAEKRFADVKPFDL
ncbi:MAG: type III-A CRISPR-associated RAMP protein Csm3 [Deltaproteobacteria bacterium]|jgi:CRISPR-associated protein Csm3|nr:type III-A CRISPR-associated RAMP protein Csm3 [Deltaproteobacteria bacterium]